MKLGERYHNFETRRYTKTGEILDIRMSFNAWRNKDGDPVGSMVILHDITEQKRLEEKFHQAQKMEAIGTLAGGIAHDFNNLLLGIQGHASMLKVELPENHPQQRHVQAVEDHVQSAASLTKQLLGIARGGRYEIKPIDLNELLAKSSEMFGRTRKEITIIKNMAPRPVVVDADRQQIEQVLLNMYVNAQHAMPDGGTLTLETASTTLDTTFCDPYKMQPGSYAKITIQDTGVGIDKVSQAKIFDPFFTTKELGRGTGLGLASAYGIIRNHKGVIIAYSEVGLGTTFNVYLPLSEGEPIQDRPVQDKVISGTETILLVDDEKATLDVCQQMLEILGYRVIPAGSGEKALETLNAWGRDIDLIVLDMIMPGMNGSQVFDRIQSLNLGIPVLLSSGYAIDDQAKKVMQKGCNGFIQKPFSIADISQRIRQVLAPATSA